MRKPKRQHNSLSYYINYIITYVILHKSKYSHPIWIRLSSAVNSLGSSDSCYTATQIDNYAIVEYISLSRITAVQINHNFPFSPTQIFFFVNTIP